VTSAALYFDNASTGEACAPTIAAPAGRSAAVNVNSGDVKLNREFDVTSSGATTILVDFNGDQSVKQEGNGSYSMSPVIAVVSVS
jgi:PKD repeat protein